MCVCAFACFVLGDFVRGVLNCCFFLFVLVFVRGSVFVLLRFCWFRPSFCFFVGGMFDCLSVFKGNLVIRYECFVGLSVRG